MLTRRRNWVWSPYRGWGLADDALRRFAGAGMFGSGGYPVNIWGNEDGYVFTAEMPGLEAASISVEVEDDVLKIEAEKKSDAPEGARYHRRERGIGKVSQSFKLPFAIEKEKVVAKYQNGILKLILPKSEASKAKKIKIES